jgi:hypothetical protein
VFPDVGRMQERFGGNAAYVKAAAAQFGIFFNDGDLQPVLSRTDSR